MIATDNEKIRELYCKNELSCVEIAHLLGYSENTVWLRLKGLGCVRRRMEAVKLAKGKGKAGWKKYRWQPKQIDWIVEHYGKGHSIMEIARLLKVSPNVVKSKLVAKEIKIRNPEEAVRRGENSFGWRGGSRRIYLCI